LFLRPKTRIPLFFAGLFVRILKIENKTFNSKKQSIFFEYPIIPTKKYEIQNFPEMKSDLVLCP